MRGERDPLNANATTANYRGNATPSTPSTASTSVRQNPLLYQRMHSNDSDKDTTNGNNNGTNSAGQSPATTIATTSGRISD